MTPSNAEARIQVSIDWLGAPQTGHGKISFVCANAKPMSVDVQVALPFDGNVSFVEDNRIVSIFASHTDTRSDGWEELAGLGHTGVSLRSKLDTTSVVANDLPALQRAPRLTYRFATTTIDDAASLRIVALPMSPITSENRLRIAVSIDCGPFMALDFSTAEFSEAWRQNVLSNTAIAQIGDLHFAAGAHELAIVALDPGVTLDRIQLSFKGANKAYGPVPETRILY